MLFRGRRDSAQGPPTVALTIERSQLESAVASMTRQKEEGRGAEEIGLIEVRDDLLFVELIFDEYRRNTRLLRRLNGLRRDGIQIVGFRWEDEVVDPKGRWLDGCLAALGRHEDGWTRAWQMAGEPLFDRLLERFQTARKNNDQLRSLALALSIAAFNTHTTAVGNSLVELAVQMANEDESISATLLDGARDIADLHRFGIDTEVGDAPLVGLLGHPEWKVHWSATRLVADLGGLRSDAVIDELVRIGLSLAGGSKSTQVRVEQVVRAFWKADKRRSDVDGVLEALIGHVSSGVRADAALALAHRRPARARGLWEPWLSSRVFNERHTAELLIAKYGDERDITEVARIAKHRSKPPKGTKYSPPLAADPIDFLVSHRAKAEAADTLDWLTRRWGKLAGDLRWWIHENHPDLVPEDAVADDDGPWGR